MQQIISNISYHYNSKNYLMIFFFLTILYFRKEIIYTNIYNFLFFKTNNLCQTYSKVSFFSFIKYMFCLKQLTFKILFFQYYQQIQRYWNNN